MLSPSDFFPVNLIQLLSRWCLEIRALRVHIHRAGGTAGLVLLFSSVLSAGAETQLT